MDTIITHTLKNDMCNIVYYCFILHAISCKLILESYIFFFFVQRFNGMQHFQHSDSSLSSESSLIIEEMSRTSPYSPEEKKVRIERYRNKRNQRNFGKKIKV